MRAKEASRNPYAYREAIRDAGDFYGRTRELAHIFDLIRNGACVNVVGERRSGKTSLLHYLSAPEVRKQYLSSDCPAIFVHLDATILTPREPESFFADIFQQVQMQCPDLSMPSLADPPDRRMRTLLTALAPHVLVVTIDEFEGISLCEAFPIEFFSFLRGLCSVYSLSLVLATHRPLWECCRQDKNISPLYNVMNYQYLGGFTSEEYEDFLKRSSVPSGFPVWELRDGLARLTGRFPFLVQMACHYAYDLWTERSSLGMADLSLVRRRFEIEARAFFADAWERYLDQAQRDALLALAQGGPVSPPTVVDALEQIGYLEQGSIASEIFACFIKERIPGRVSLPRGPWVDECTGNVYLNGDLITPPLTEKEFLLLKLLCANRGKICDYYDVIKAVYGEQYMDDADDQRIAALLRRLRKRVEPDGKPWRFIKTVFGRGLTLGDGTPSTDEGE